MGAEQNTLTLQGLAQRLEDQTQRLEALERENTELRHKVATLQRSVVTAHQAGDQKPASEPSNKPNKFEGRMSRRGLLDKAAAATVGVVAAGALTQLDIREAKAAIVSGSTNTASRGAVEGTNEHMDGYGVWGNSKGYGVLGWGDKSGVWGTGQQYGVVGSGTTAGVSGVSRENGAGVVGAGPIGVEGRSSSTTSPGVLGANEDAVGVTGTGKIGVNGLSSTAGFPAVYGNHFGTGGIGVRGDCAKDGYGGQFRGGKAQLRLLPQATNGRPTTGNHNKGEIYMDARGFLFVCTATGNPGAWRRVDTTVV